MATKYELERSFTPQSRILRILLDQGVTGVIIIILSGYIYLKDQSHEKERETWRETTNAIIKQNTDSNIALQKSLSELSTIMRELKK